MRSVQKVTLTEAVIQEIITQIQLGRLVPGDRLPGEKTLMQELGVSRPVLREALRSLATMNVVEIRPGSGAVVCDVQKLGMINSEMLGLLLEQGRELAQLHEARLTIEVTLAGWAAERAGDNEFECMEAALERLKGADRVDETVTAAREFHLSVAYASRNPILAQLVAPLYDTLQKHVARRGQPLFSPEGEYRIHKELYEVIRSGDPAAAREEMKRHLEISHRRWYEAGLGDESETERHDF